MNKDTIAAIATALSESGIGIIRISGPEAVSICDKLLVNKNGNPFLGHMKSHTIHYGYVVNPSVMAKVGAAIDNQWKSAVIDEVLVTFMKGPKSFTAEDVVEIHCHGGVFLVRKVLEIVLSAGARLAEPGEFSKRAFLNGRIDLTEAEAVMDLISSKSEASAKSSIHQLNGFLHQNIKLLREKIIYEIAFIESALDDPEHISLDGYPEQLNEKLGYLISNIKKLLDSSENGKYIKEGISTVILGKPNAGKSSLMNLLLGEDRAIVTDIAGTTRDTLEEYIHLRGIGLRLVDTAGIRRASDLVEQIGVDRAKESASMADLLIYVVDSSKNMDRDDRDIVSLFGNKRVILLLNKSDLDSVTSPAEVKTYLKKAYEELGFIDDIPAIIPFSAKTGEGLKEFSDLVEQMFYAGGIDSDSEIVITNMRHKQFLQEAYDSLCLVQRSIEDGMEEDFFSIDLMNAYSSLGKIIGEEVEDDLVQEIFTKFCMGK